MELEINVVKALTNQPIHNATVQVFLVHGETQVGGSLFTDSAGETKTQVYTNGTYKVVANAQGFVELSVETNPPDSCLDRSSFLVTLPLSPVEDDVLDCTNCSV